MASRLADATSPYLRQHADNPVDWWPWSDDAFAEARRRDVPVMLSVGYAACHWCHVMAHESFENAATAALLNAHFVSIKVDREERPDIDAVYMAATQALTGSGGWPMTVFLDHDGHAFYAGTYFPPRPQHGRPSFTDVLLGLDEVWRTQRDRVSAAAERLHEALTPTGARVAVDGDATYADVAEAVAQCATEFDPRRGGFGSAPKFPATPLLEFLLRAHALAETVAQETTDGSGTAAPTADVAGVNSHRSTAAPTANLALTMAARTLTAMVRGGLYDQLTGGFARYSVDAEWVVPHFEKMLSDNAQLLRVYLHWWRTSGDPLARRVAEETSDFLLSELRTREGGFASSLDADSGGREGAFAVWTPAQLDSALGPEDGAWVAQLCSVTVGGTFEAGASVLQLAEDPDDPERWQRCRATLAAVRSARPAPLRDDKVVAAWNGLAIGALAEAGALLRRTDLLDAATACAAHLQAVHWSRTTQRLTRVSLGGRVNHDAHGVLEDYADLAEGLLALYQVSGHEGWYRWASELLDVALGQFQDDDAFFDTAADAPALVRRPQDPTDGVAPSGWSATANALTTAAALSGEVRYREAALRALRSLLPLARRSPRFTGWTWTAITSVLAGPVQVAVVLPDGAGRAPEDPATDLRLAALRSTSPGLVVATGTEGSATVPLLTGRPAVEGRPTAYVCRGFVCDLPVTTVAALEEAIVR
jgi:uncharacterized protein YyaL (SSP411 family)